LCGNGGPAERILRTYLAGQHECAVFTHPGSNLNAAAEDLGLPVTTDSVNNLGAWPFYPDLLASVYYRTLIAPIVLDRVFAFNAHTSLLPYNRGRSPIPWAIIGGDTYTGVTYHWIDEGIDSGPIILQAAVRIAPDETQASLFTKIDQAVIDFWPSAWALACAKVPGVPQPTGGSIHFGGRPPFGGVIDPNWSREGIERFIRAMTYPPRPGATYAGEPVASLEDYDRIRNERIRNAQRCARFRLP
jgi:methionyl-tRNA formyltransferase